MSESVPPTRHSLPWVRLVTIVAVMAIGVSGLWVVIRQVADTDVPDADPATEIASPVASPPATPGTPGPATPPGEEATPEGNGEPAWPTGSLPAMLDSAPDRLADDSLPLNDVAQYADIAGWMAANGVAPPETLTDPELAAWEAELANLAISPSLRERGLDPVWQATYGFDLTQVEQVLSIGQAPDYVTILRGTFDPEVLQAAWVSSGYQAVEVEGQTIWSLFPGDTIDLSAQASRPAMGTFNNVAVLDDGTLVAAAKTSRLGSTLEVVNGNAPSLAENDDVAALLLPGTGVERLASAVISKGSLLQATVGSMPASGATPTPTTAPIATPEDETGMPEVNVVLLGIPLPAVPDRATPEGQVEAHRLTMLFVVDDMADAQAARREIVARLERDRSPATGEPYTDRIANPAVALLEGDDRALVRITGTLADGALDWLDILDDRDLGFAFWLPEE